MGIAAVSAFALLCGDQEYRNQTAIGLFPTQVVYKTVTVGLVRGGMTNPVTALNADIALHHAVAHAMHTSLSSDSANPIDDASQHAYVKRISLEIQLQSIHLCNGIQHEL